MKKLITIFILLLCVGLIVACVPDEPTVTYYTVTFDTGEGGTAIPSQEVRNGQKAEKPNDPERSGYIFTGVWKNGNFEWNFDLDIVTNHVTLVAEWLEISGTPTNITVGSEAFSSDILWQQTDADLQTFTVSIKPVSGSNFTELVGSVEIDTTSVMHLVRFTPDVLPEGGYYIVKVTADAESVDSEPLLLGGAGTEGNPYLVSKLTDMIAILENSSLSDKHYRQLNDITSTLTDPLEINNARRREFAGVYDGNGFSMSFTGNGGLFHKILESGVVKNLTVLSSTQLYAAEANLYSIGVIANENHGLIENITSRAIIENVRLQGALPVYAGVDTSNLTTGAGGIAGLNGATGIIKNVTVSGAGAIKAGRGIGGVVAYNFGLVEHATVTATLPAGNQANSANSSNTYSYGGGIAGFNFGTIQFTAVTGRVFAQSAYAESGTGNEGKNVGFGGIAGYNEGIITESSFARSLAAKEFIDKSRAAELQDAANNLGVASIHGDMYVGGIAGINAGSITSVYVGGALIGARDFVGGITGLTLTGGTIENSYVFAEVAVKDNGGNKITVPNAKTTVTTYEIAPSGFNASNVFYKPLVNSSTDATWVPGDVASPKLPEFTSADLTAVGNKFAASGVLLWQQGSVTGVNIVLDNVVLPFGTQLELEYTVSPASAPDIFTTWESSNEDVVAIIGEGVIEAVGEGTAIITVTTRDGGFTDTISVTVEDYTRVDTVNVTSPEFTLPVPNTPSDRPTIEIGTVINFVVDILPIDAQYQGYTLSSSNSRAVVDGNQVTFVTGLTGPGNVSITISFEDSSVTSLEYRFLTIPASVDPGDVPIEQVIVTAGDFELPAVNNADDRPEVEVGTEITLSIEILPADASNQNYTITISNSRATVDGHTVTFVTGNGLGAVSIFITFEDPAIGQLNYRFTTIAAPVDPEDVSIDEVNVTAGEFALPSVNNASDRPEVEIGTEFTLSIEILPVDATNKNYTVVSSQLGRATVDGLTVTVIGTGNFSVRIQFEDTSVGNAGLLEYRFLGIEAPADPEDIAIEEVIVTAGAFILPTPNNTGDRPEVEIGTVITFTVEILPANASNQNYTITTSNTRSTVDGNTVTFVTGSGPGNTSVNIIFEDPAATNLEYRFLTVEAPAEIEAEVTTEDITLGEPNVVASKAFVVIGTVVTFDISFTPVDPEATGYTITPSNGRATVDGNQVTFVQSTGAGNVSLTFIFDDPSIPNVIYYFTTTNE